MATSSDSVHDWAAPTGGPGDAPAGAPVASSGGMNADPGPMPPPLHAAPGAGPVHSAPLTYRSWQPGIVALRPLSFGDFLTVPFRGFRYNRAVTIGGPTLMTLLSSALTVLAGWLLLSDPLLGLGDYFTSVVYAPNPSLGIQPLTVVALAVAVLAWFAADMLASAIVLVGTSRAVLGERVSLGEAWRQMVPRLPQLTVLYLLTGVVWVVLTGVGVGLWLLGASTGLDFLGPIIVVILLFLMIPISVVMAVYLPAARGAVLMEGATAVTSIRRTFSLMKGRFWWTVLILLVVGTVVGVVAQVVQTGAQFMAFFVMFAAPENYVLMMLVFAAGYGLAVILSNVVTYAYMGSVYGLIYLDARMRREGFDVDLARAAEARHLGARRAVG